MSSSPSISRWINYVRILTCSSQMLQLLKTTCCLNSGLAIVAQVPWNLWHHTQSIIKSLVALCLSISFSRGFYAERCMQKVVQMLFVSEQGFQASDLWLQMFIFKGLLCNHNCADLPGFLRMFSAMLRHCFFQYIVIELLWSLGEKKKCNTCTNPEDIFCQQPQHDCMQLSHNYKDTGNEFYVKEKKP